MQSKFGDYFGLGGGNGFADGLDDGLVGRETDPALLRYLAAADPDGEFTAVAFDQVGVEIELQFDRGRRTEGPRSIGRSNRAEADAYVGHVLLVAFCATGSQFCRGRRIN